jgi:hypothetical protein
MDYELLDVLQSIAVEVGCAVVLTNNLTPDVVESSSEPLVQLKPVLGPAHHHRINQQLILTKKKDGTIIAGTQKNFTKGFSAVTMKITAHGVSDGDP